jgi:hypothetical protein
MPGEAAPGRDPREPVPIRASDAEREHVMDLLRDAASEGRLTFEELADRIAAAGTARTRDELAALTADLPVTGVAAGSSRTDERAGDHDPPPDGWSDPVVGSRNDPAIRAPERCTAIFGDLRQAGPWRVPYVGRWSTVFGDIDLDLREAVVSHARIHLEASSVFGDVTLLVPQGVRVDVRARTGFGKVRQEAGQHAPDGAPVVELTGFTWFGDVRVRAKRLREHLTDLFRGRLGAGGAQMRWEPRPGPAPGERRPGNPDS